jgi:hypothetical protein
MLLSDPISKTYKLFSSLNVNEALKFYKVYFKSFLMSWKFLTHLHSRLCTLKADSQIACRAHAVPLPCRAAKGLECVFPIWFTQCDRVWFTLAMPCSDHAVLLKATAQHGCLSAVLCCGLEKNGMVRSWHGRGMASMNQTRSHCVNPMGKTHFTPFAAGHGRGTAWARHAMCESAFTIASLSRYLSI